MCPSKDLELTVAHRGAVLSLLPNEAIVTSTVARSHYGVCANSLYDDSEDTGQPTWYDASIGKRKIKKAS